MMYEMTNYKSISTGLILLAPTVYIKKQYIDRGPLAKIISFRGIHLGNTWFMVYLKDI